MAAAAAPRRWLRRGPWRDVDVEAEQARSTGSSASSSVAQHSLASAPTRLLQQRRVQARRDRAERCRCVEQGIQGISELDHGCHYKAVSGSGEVEPKVTDWRRKNTSSWSSSAPSGGAGWVQAWRGWRGLVPLEARARPAHRRRPTLQGWRSSGGGGLRRRREAEKAARWRPSGEEAVVAAQEREEREKREERESRADKQVPPPRGCHVTETAHQNHRCDISSNNMTGVLPSSMKSLASLTTLHMQDNQLSGTLNVLQDLPLKDLNIENNMFSGPVPASLLNIPNFKKDGNPFNTSIAPSASPPSPSTGSAPTPTPAGPKPAPAPTSSNSTPVPAPPSPASRAPPPSKTTSNSSEGSTTRDSTSSSSSSSSSRKHSTSTLKVVGFVLLGVVLFIIMVLLLLFCLSKYEERQSRYDHNRSQLTRVHHRVEPQIKPPPVQQRDDVKKGQSEALDRRDRELSSSAAALPKKSPENQKEHVINFDRTESDLFPVLPPPPPPPPLPPIERVVANPIVPPEKRYSPPPRTSTPTSATPFSVASLQQYTNSFSEENVIRESRLGKVYLAELPDGKLLEVMKIDNANGRISVDDFLEQVECISEIKHPNILELVGYCAEYGQRLLVYNHFSRTTLDDALHDAEETGSALSWIARLQVALGSGKALEYLHESFHPPIVHQNFEPANVLLDKKFSVCVAECGLAEMMPSGSVTQLSGRMRALMNYEAPEFQDSGVISERGDVYSFGVVMLELLTGRKPYDSSRPRHEQHLVRWASSQLHDIESLSKMVDPSIRGQCSEKALSRFADIISRCVQRQPEFRPPMSEIVQDLARLVNATGEESE